MAMVKLQDFPIFDLTGGLRLDKSDYQLADNEVSRALNFEFREKGRVKRRRGFHQLGQNIAQTPNTVESFFRDASGSILIRTYAITRLQTTAAPTVYVLRTTRLTANLATTDVTMTVAATGGFSAATSILEVEGDLITYTAIPDGTSFTVTASTIRVAHTAGAAVNQWVAVTPSTGAFPSSQLGNYLINFTNIFFLKPP